MKPTTNNTRSKSFATRTVRADRRGVSLLYLPFMMVMLIGFSSVAIDWGRVQVAKSQLLHAADAAARAGALRLSTGSNADAVAAAMAIAGENSADGSSVSLLQSDVEVGNWDDETRTFTPVVDNEPANAVRVTARRLANRGNAVQLAAASIFGHGTCDVTVQAIAASAPSQGYGIVGLDSVSMSGRSSDSYNSVTGLHETNASVATNGKMSMSGSAEVQGDVYYGKSLKTSGHAAITGTRTKLTRKLFYPIASAGTFVTRNDDANVPSDALKDDGSFKLDGKDSATLPGGTYYFKDFEVNGEASVAFLGKTTIYVTGKFSLSGRADTNGNRPENLTIILCNGEKKKRPGDIKISGKSELFADIYAPLSKFDLSGSSQLYGRIVSKSINMSGSSAIHFDTTLPGLSGVESVK